MNVSFVVPFDPLRPEHVPSYPDRRGSVLWRERSVPVEPHQSFAFAAGPGYRIPVGTSVEICAWSRAAPLGAPAVAEFGPGASAPPHRSLPAGEFIPW